MGLRGVRFAPGFAPGRPVSLEPAWELAKRHCYAPDPAHPPWCPDGVGTGSGQELEGRRLGRKGN